MFRGEIGTCIKCGRPKTLIVVRAGLCKICNEKRKKEKKVKKLFEKGAQTASIKGLIKELDRVFSIFIRTREADAEGITMCFTCGKTDRWKNMDCGHYHSRRIYSLRWNEKNCHVQCKKCNIFMEGNKPAFAEALKRKYGNGILERLDMIKNNQIKLDRFVLQMLIKRYEAHEITLRNK